jgi:hypothetical protein
VQHGHGQTTAREHGELELCFPSIDDFLDLMCPSMITKRHGKSTNRTYNRQERRYRAMNFISHIFCQLIHLHCHIHYRP